MVQLRVDSRENNQVRALQCEQGQLGRADGSALFAHGATELLAGIYGPCDVKPNKEQLNVASINVSLKPATAIAGVVEKASEADLRGLLNTVIMRTLHPRTSIAVELQIRRDDGSTFACAINASCLALVDAGVSLHCMFAAAAVAIDQDGTLIMDPTAEEERAARATFTFAFSNSDSNLLASKAVGQFSEGEYFSALQASQEATGKILAFLRQSVERRHQKP